MSAATASSAEAPFPEKQQRQPAGAGADDGRVAFINRLGRLSDPVAVAKAHAIAAQIWSDYCQGTFDRSLMAYQPLINGKEVGLLEALGVRGGEVLLDQGQPVTTVYLVLAGEARILIHDGGSLKVVGTSRRGELLGEMTLLNAANKGASARIDTSEGLDLLALDINDLLAV